MYLLEMCEARDASELAMYRDTFLLLLLVVRSCETVGRQSPSAVSVPQGPHAQPSHTTARTACNLMSSHALAQCRTRARHSPSNSPLAHNVVPMAMARTAKVSKENRQGKAGHGRGCIPRAGSIYVRP